MHSDGENIISGKKICAYLINMDGAEERLRKSDEELRNAGINYKRMPAVNGNEISFPIKEFSEISYKVLHGRRTVPPEVGCYLSHINCMNDFLESSMDYAIIFEDDITIMPEFKKNPEPVHSARQPLGYLKADHRQFRAKVQSDRNWRWA